MYVLNQSSRSPLDIYKKEVHTFGHIIRLNMYGPLLFIVVYRARDQLKDRDSNKRNPLFQFV